MEFCDAETDASLEECDSPSLLCGYTDAFLVEERIRRIVEGDKGQSFMEPTKEDCIAKKGLVYPEHEKVKTAKDMCVAPISTVGEVDLMNESQTIQDGGGGQSSMKRRQKSRREFGSVLLPARRTRQKDSHAVWSLLLTSGRAANASRNQRHGNGPLHKLGQRRRTAMTSKFPKGQVFDLANSFA